MRGNGSIEINLTSHPNNNNTYEGDQNPNSKIGKAGKKDSESWGPEF